ncbi:assembly of actin patch protein [Malassezia yamatoensis]|uniref:Assembly of actin patch protein n=1 Tax=Malassezia yamatoensis TaxID=253288 RepID=A0AAJ5YQW6_9BASI|nr:assembly of actin patch protein [Malassezia yamatoensis]
MASIHLVRSIVKYKSPHPQDLSFPKDAIICVTGLAQRPNLDDEDEDEDEDDQWYIGELLDGSKHGQFPASLTRPLTQSETEEIHSVHTAPKDVSPRNPHNAETTSLVGTANEAISTKSSDNPLDVPVNTLYTPKESGDTIQTQPMSQTTEPSRVVEGAHEQHPIATEPQLTTSLEAVKQENPVNATEASSLHAASPNENKEDLVPETPLASIPPTLPTTSESIRPMPLSPDRHKKAASSLDTFTASEPDQQSITEPLTEETNKSTIAAPHSTVPATRPASSQPTEVPDPSRLSLRERIAAFNKPAEKSAPPIPRGKPGAWKRPAPVGNGEKPPMPPASNMPPLAPGDTSKVTNPGNIDKPTIDATSSESFSASDARSSIQMSLKERMAALQRHDAEAKPAPPAPPRKLSRDLQVDPEPSQEEADQDPDEASRRAAIAQRMARMGGQRMGPFGGVVPSAQQSVTNSEQDPEQNLHTSSDPVQSEQASLQQNADSDNNVSAQVSLPKPTEAQDGGSATLIIPRRTAAPRSRRVPHASETVSSPIDESQQKVTSDALNTDQSPARTTSVDSLGTGAESTATASPINQTQAPIPEQQIPDQAQNHAVQVPLASEPSGQESKPTQDRDVVPSLSEAATDIVPETGDTSFIDTAHSTAGNVDAPSQITPESFAIHTNEPTRDPSRSVEHQPDALQSKQVSGSEEALAMPHVTASGLPSEPNVDQSPAPEPQFIQRGAADPISATTDITTDPLNVRSANVDQEIPLPNPHPDPTLPPVYGETASHPASHNVAEAIGISKDARADDLAGSTFPNASSDKNHQDDDEFANERYQLEQLIGAPISSSQQDPNALASQASTVDNAMLEQTPKPVQKEAGYARVTPVIAESQSIHQDEPRSELGYLASNPVPDQEIAPALGSRPENLNRNLTSPETSMLQTNVPEDVGNQTRSAPMFIPSPSDGASPSMGASLPLDPETQLTQSVSPEQSQQDRRAELAQRMARLGGQRIAGFPGMPAPTQQSSMNPGQDKIPVLPPATPSALPEAPILPQDSQLPDVPDVAPPASEAAQTVAPRPPARTAPTLPTAEGSEELQDGQASTVEDAIVTPPVSESPLTRPPPSRAPPPPSM